MLSRPPPRHRWFTWLGLLVFFSLCFIVGFVFFVSFIVPRPQEKPTPMTLNAEAWPVAVVLTGGSLRLAEGIKALQQGWAERLFVSGVYHSTEVKQLLELYQTKDNQTQDIHIELGFEAEDTIGNGVEIATWLMQHQITRALVITSDYHMPRAMLELKAQAQGVAFTPWPVFPRHVRLQDWWLHPNSSLLLAEEYAQYLLTWARLHTIALFPF